MTYTKNNLFILSIIFICNILYYGPDIFTYNIALNSITLLISCLFIFMLPIFLFTLFFTKKKIIKDVSIGLFACYIFAFIPLIYYLYYVDFSLQKIINELLIHRGYRIWDRNFASNTFSLYYYLAQAGGIISIYEFTKRIFIIKKDKGLIFLFNILILFILILFYSLEGSRISIYIPLISVILFQLNISNYEFKFLTIKNIFIILCILMLSNYISLFFRGMGNASDSLFVGSGTEVRQNILSFENNSKNPILLIKSDDALARFSQIKILNNIYKSSQKSAFIRYQNYFSYHFTKIIPRQIWTKKSINPGFEPHKMLGISGYTIAYGFIGEGFLFVINTCIIISKLFYNIFFNNYFINKVIKYIFIFLVYFIYLFFGIFIL